jgi:flagellar hook-associated protein 1 FlgK
VTAGRQQAQASLVSEVGTLNSTLAQIGTLNRQIVQLQAQGQSTADLQNQRDAARDQLSQLLNVTTLQQPNGTMLLMTSSGLMLPTTEGTPFSLAPANPGPTTSYPNNGVPGILLGGTDVTGQMQGGTIGGNITLRDATLPTLQAGLDEFAQTLSTRFANQGLQLFTDPAGNVPTATGPNAQSGYVGYAAAIQVNPAIVATPSLVRDGTTAVAGFTPNPAGGPAGFNTLIGNVLTYAMGSDSASGVPQPAPNATGLGPDGNLSLGFAPPPGVTGFAAALAAAQAQASSGVTTAVTNETAVQTALQSKMSATSGVSMDTEMSNMIQLQNLYTANARLIGAVQSMWTQTLQLVQ